MFRFHLQKTVLFIVLTLTGCQPKTRGPRHLTELEWKTTADVVGAIKRAAEYKDSEPALFEPRYAEAEKLADSAVVVLKDHPQESKQLVNCSRKVGEYRERQSYLRSLERADEIVRQADADVGLFPPLDPTPENKQKERIKQTEQKINVCIAAIEGYL